MKHNTLFTSSLPADQLRYWVALSFAPHPHRKLQALAYYLANPNQDQDLSLPSFSLVSHDIEILFKANPSYWKRANLSAAQIAYLQSPPWKHIDQSIAQAHQRHWHIATLQDPTYPTLLKEIPDPPLVLWIAGDLGCLHQPQLAIVGSRNASHEGIENAYQFAKQLSDRQIKITSGLARGIDAASHQGALHSDFPQTIAVMGSGLDQIYPRSNQKLADQILEKQGAIVTELILGTQPNAFHFPRRNRIIAGLSLGTLVVEAAFKSGSLITAHLALDYNRHVFAIPNSIHHPLGKGCHRLLRQGATLVETVDDIVTELTDYFPNQLHIDKKQTKNGLTRTADLDKDQIFLLKCLDYQPTPVDKIIARSGFTATKVATLLTDLCLQGWVNSEIHGYRREQDRE